MKLRLCIFIVFAALFALDFVLVEKGMTQAFDDSVLGTFVGLRADALTAIVKAVTSFGNPLTVIILCVVLIILPGRMKVGLPVALMTVVGFAAQTLFKAIVARPRPDMAYWLIEESSSSFPSGHANISIVFWFALLVLLGRALTLRGNRAAAVLIRIILAVFAVLIGVSRLYLGVHFASDVFGGWLLAGSLLPLLFIVYDRLWPTKWRIPIS